MTNQLHILTCTICTLKLYSIYCRSKSCNTCCDDILCNKHGKHNRKKVSNALKNMLLIDIISVIANYINQKEKCYF